MSKNKPKNKAASPRPPVAPAPPAAPAPTVSPARAIAEHFTGLVATASPAQVAAAAVAPPAVVEDLAAAARELGQARALLVERERALEHSQLAAEKRRDDLSRRQGEIETRELELDDSRQKLDARSKTLADGQRLLAERGRHLAEAEAALERQRVDLAMKQTAAEAGFAAELRAALAGHDHHAAALRGEIEALRQRKLDLRAELDRLHHDQIDALTTELSTRRDNLERTLQDRREEVERELDERRAALVREHDKARSALTAELASHRATHDAALRKDRDELDRGREDLERDRLDLKKQQLQLELRRELLTEERADLDERVAARAAADVERLTYERDTALAALAETRTRRDALEQTLRAREEADRRFGHEPPEQILREREQLRDRCDELARTLAERLEPDAAARLERLERERDDWQRERSELLRRIAEAQRCLERSEIAVWEVENLRDQKAALERSRDLLRHVVDQLRKDIDERISRNEGSEVFPAFLKMDRDPDLQAAPDLYERIELDAFIDDVRERIAHTGLFYGHRDLRCFVAGLAASRLHILQGISGTGKTSLPLAFASAIGTEAVSIAVQAGWRDRQDLIGHFNAFDKVFHETEFVQALYRARCPGFSARPFIVLLDEMNLSHPEQYFADFNYILEQVPGRRFVDLIPASPRGSIPPAGLTDGRRLPLPDNVWFIGTANHDETTKDFADKTFDRAHIMELPRIPEPFQPRKKYDRSPLSLRALQLAFEEARQKYADEAARAYSALRSLSEPLADDFELGWGARLDRQWKSFVPVVRAAGGPLGEAVDHMLASKILRQLRDRHDLRVDALERLRDHVRKLIKQVDPTWREPPRSLAAIQRELTRLGAERSPA